MKRLKQILAWKIEKNPFLSETDRAWLEKTIEESIVEYEEEKQYQKQRLKKNKASR